MRELEANITDPGAQSDWLYVRHGDAIHECCRFDDPMVPEGEVVRSLCALTLSPRQAAAGKAPDAKSALDVTCQWCRRVIDRAARAFDAPPMLTDAEAHWLGQEILTARLVYDYWDEGTVTHMCEFVLLGPRTSEVRARTLCRKSEDVPREKLSLYKRVMEFWDEMVPMEDVIRPREVTCRGCNEARVAQELTHQPEPYSPVWNHDLFRGLYFVMGQANYYPGDSNWRWEAIQAPCAPGPKRSERARRKPRKTSAGAKRKKR